MLVMDGKMIRHFPMKETFLCMFILLALFFSSSAFAARPLTTDDAGTVERGKFQLEVGFEDTRQVFTTGKSSPSLT